MDAVSDFSRGDFSALRPNMPMPGGQPPDTGSHKYRDQYNAATEKVPEAAAAGMLMNPLNMMG
jgi:hypothetical protein